MQAITTKYVPATDHRGARIVARCDAGRITIPYPYGANDPHSVAAAALRDKLGWTEAKGYPPMYGGEAYDGCRSVHSVFVFAHESARLP